MIFATDLAFSSDLQVSPKNDLDTMSGLRNLKEALFRRLITEKGSLLHRPNYGIGIKKYLNAPNTLAAKQELAGEIIEQFPQDERVEKVHTVRVVNDDQDPSKVTFIVKVEAKSIGPVEFTFITE